MGTRLDISGFPAGFTVGGHGSGSGPLGWTWHRTVGATFSADAAAVGRLLPSALHALRLSPRRGLVMVGGSLCEWHAGSLPAFRSLDMQVYALVTSGSRPAPPLLPMAGLSAGGGRAWFGAGFVPLLVVTTNRLARGIYRDVMGWPVVLADARAEDLPGHVRLTCSDAGRTLLDLVVRTDCKFREFCESQPWYGVRDGVLFRAVTAGKGSGGDVNGPGTGRLDLGDHPAVAPLRSMGLSRGSWSASVCGTFDQSLTGPVVAIGPALLAAPEPPPQPGGPDRTALLVSAAGRESRIDQGLAALPFDPGADLRADPIPGLADAVSGGTPPSPRPR